LGSRTMGAHEKSETARVRKGRGRPAVTRRGLCPQRGDTIERKRPLRDSEFCLTTDEFSGGVGTEKKGRGGKK